MTYDPVLIAYAVKRAGSTKKASWTRIILLERDDEDDDRLQREAIRALK